MPRKKSPVPDQKHVNPVAKMKRAAQLGRRPGSPKPRVVAGTPAARALGIGIPSTAGVSEDGK